MCGRLLGNLRQNVATPDSELPVLLVTVRSEAFDDLERAVGLEWRGDRQDPIAVLCCASRTTSRRNCARSRVCGSTQTPCCIAAAPEARSMESSGGHTSR